MMRACLQSGAAVPWQHSTGQRPDDPQRQEEHRQRKHLRRRRALRHEHVGERQLRRPEAVDRDRHLHDEDDHRNEDEVGEQRQLDAERAAEAPRLQDADDLDDDRQRQHPQHFAVVAGVAPHRIGQRLRHAVEHFRSGISGGGRRTHPAARSLKTTAAATAQRTNDQREPGDELRRAPRCRARTAAPRRRPARPTARPARGPSGPTRWTPPGARRSATRRTRDRDPRPRWARSC